MTEKLLDMWGPCYEPRPFPIYVSPFVKKLLDEAVAKGLASVGCNVSVIADTLFNLPDGGGFRYAKRRKNLSFYQKNRLSHFKGKGLIFNKLKNRHDAF